MRLVCVGDSFTEGVADDVRPDGEHLGWSDRVATALARTQAVEYANLAVRGKLLDQVVDVFYVTDSAGEKIRDEVRLALIRDLLTERIARFQQGSEL